MHPSGGPWRQTALQVRPTARLSPACIADPRGGRVALLCDAQVDIGPLMQETDLGSTGTYVSERQLSFQRNDPPESFAWSADGVLLVVGSRRALHIYAASDDFKKLLELPLCYFPSSVAIAVTNDMNKYLVATAGCTGVELRSVLLEDGGMRIKGSIVRHDSLAIALVHFSASGGSLAVACLDGHLGVWCTRGAFNERSDLWSIHMDESRVTSFSFSPCELLLAVGFWGDSYAIFESEHRREWVLVQHCRGNETLESASFAGCFVQYATVRGATILIVSWSAQGIVIGDARSQRWRRAVPGSPTNIKGIAVQRALGNDNLVYFARFGAFGTAPLASLIDIEDFETEHSMVIFEGYHATVRAGCTDASTANGPVDLRFSCVFRDEPQPSTAMVADGGCELDGPGQSRDAQGDGQRAAVRVFAPFLDPRDFIPMKQTSATPAIVQCSRAMLAVQHKCSLYMYVFKTARWSLLILHRPITSFTPVLDNVVAVLETSGRLSMWQASCLSSRDVQSFQLLASCRVDIQPGSRAFLTDWHSARNRVAVVVIDLHRRASVRTYQLGGQELEPVSMVDVTPGLVTLDGDVVFGGVNAAGALLYRARESSEWLQLPLSPHT